MVWKLHYQLFYSQNDSITMTAILSIPANDKLRLKVKGWKTIDSDQINTNNPISASMTIFKIAEISP